MKKLYMFISIFLYTFVCCEKFDFTEIPTLETKRLILRKPDLTDAASVFAMSSNPDVVKLTGMFDLHTCMEQAQKFITRSMEHYSNKEAIPWIVVEKETNRVIGFVRIMCYSPANFRAEIGYTFIQDVWNKGYCTEAARELLRFGFERLDVVRMQATCDPRNIGSKLADQSFLLSAVRNSVKI